MKQEIYHEIQKLKLKFYNIHCRNWILSKGVGTGAAGRTFEYLIGKEKEDQNCLPDYHGIEIKTRFRNGAYPISLFSMAPDNKPKENERLLKMYGYPDKTNPQFKSLFFSVSGDVKQSVGIFYSYRLVIDYEARKVRLAIYLGNRFIESRISWSFEELRSRLSNKLSYLALVYVRGYKLDEKQYFKHEDIHFYQLKSFDYFLRAIENGAVCVTIKLTHYKSGERYGQFKNHGTDFCIKEDDLLKLFDPIDKGDA